MKISERMTQCLKLGAAAPSVAHLYVSCWIVTLCAAPSRHVDERRRLLSTESLLVERKYRTATLPSCN